MGGLGSATVQAIVTKHVPSNRVGQLLGAVDMLLALSRILGPLLFNGIYAATVGTFPQAIFVLLASLYGISFLASFAVRPHGELLLLPRGFVYAKEMRKFIGRMNRRRRQGHLTLDNRHTTPARTHSLLMRTGSVSSRSMIGLPAHSQNQPFRNAHVHGA